MTKVQQLLAATGLGVAAMAFVPGCASDNWPSDVPHTASLNTEGNGHLAFTAPSSGTVYVYDDSGDRLLYSGHVIGGQRVVVDPHDNRIDVDDHKVSDQSLGNESRYKIYFDPTGPRLTEHRVLDERTDTVVPSTTDHRVIEEHRTDTVVPGTTEHHVVEEHRVERVE